MSHIALDPNELGFRRPFTQEVTQSLTIKNTHYEPIAFKVKTTAPKQYCVRPNSGRIEAGQSVSVKVLLQQMKDDPPPDYKCKDKFLVQSVAITADLESQNTAEIWAWMAKNDKGSIQEKKIRVVFLSEEGAVNGLSVENTSRPPSFQDSTTTSRSVPAGPASKPESKPDDYAGKDATSHFMSTPASSPPSSDLSAQLAEIRQQNLKLRKQLAEFEGRNSGANEKGASGQLATQTQQGPDGVSVKIVAVLCLVSFLLALLF